MKRPVYLVIIASALLLCGAGVVVHQKLHMPLPALPVFSSAKDVFSDVEKTRLAAAKTSLAKGGEIIDKVWAGNPVRFAIVTSDKYISIGYYDTKRQLTIAQRAISGGKWTYKKLDTVTNWDSHNSVNMVLDNSGRLHIAANMHAAPLTYYMSDTSGDIASLARVPVLVNKASERQMTYPTFLRDADKRLILTYRAGASGDGNDIYNVFDDKTATWSSLIDKPLISGQGKRNAYPTPPLMGPDRYFHMAWVWRDTPMSETTHDLSYARSRDLVHWEKADGTSIALPITYASGEIVDPVPVKGGIINGNVALGFDAKKQVMIAYHKYDAQGNSQIYLARREGDSWHIAQISQWKDYRWSFAGGGSMTFEVVVGKPRQNFDDIVVSVKRQDRSTTLRVRADNLTPIGEYPNDAIDSEENATIAAIKPPVGMILNQQTAEEGDARYTIGWATNPPNRDKPYAKTPEPSTLVLFEKKAPKEAPKGR